jgi:hypothetical protein
VLPSLFKLPGWKVQGRKLNNPDGDTFYILK